MQKLADSFWVKEDKPTFSQTRVGVRGGAAGPGKEGLGLPLAACHVNLDMLLCL
jgi:hypothetical protein